MSADVKAGQRWSGREGTIAAGWRIVIDRPRADGRGWYDTDGGFHYNERFDPSDAMCVFDLLPDAPTEQGPRVPQAGDRWRFSTCGVWRLLSRNPSHDEPGTWMCFNEQTGNEHYMHNVGITSAWTLVSRAPAPTPPVEVPPRERCRKDPYCARVDGHTTHCTVVPAAAPPVPEKRVPVETCFDCDAAYIDREVPLRVVGILVTARRRICDDCYLTRERNTAWTMEAERVNHAPEPLPRDSWQPQASRQGTCWRTRGGRW